MPQFDADSIVEALEYTFAYKVGKTVMPGPSGVIAEPSDQQIGAFLSRLKKVMKEAQATLGLKEEVDVTDTEQVAKALDELDPDEFVKVADQMADMHADLCGGSPSKAEILALPMRRRMLFYQWLQSEVMSPEAASGAGNGQVRHLPSRAAG